jgi:hypothetical protein
MAIEARDKRLMMVIHWRCTLELLATLVHARRTPNFCELATLVPDG